MKFDLNVILVCGFIPPIDKEELKLKKWFNLIHLLLVLTLIPSGVFASGTITGTLTTPTISVPLSNVSISLTLSQAGVDVTNTYNLATTPVQCATDSIGSVRGIKDPLIQPIASATNSGGTLSGGYFAKIAYFDLSGNITYPSPVLSVNVTGPNNAITFTAPSLHPFSAIGYKTYLGLTSGSEKLQSTVTGWGSSIITTYNGSGTAVPTSNSTVCTLTFNDSIIPSYTTYTVSILNSNGGLVGGFPQSWYLSGTTLNIASIIPVSNINVKYQTPILSNPLSSYATQSINSPLTLNGFAFSSGSNTTTGNMSVSGALTVTGASSIGGDVVIGSTGSSLARLDVKTATNQHLLVVPGSSLGGTNGVGLESVNDANSSILGLTLVGIPIYLNTGSGGLVVDSQGRISSKITSALPTIGINAGSATLTTNSNDNIGLINVTHNGSSTITLTFGAAFTTAPSCVVSPGVNNPTMVSAIASTTTLIITGATGSGTDTYNYHCIKFGS